MEGSCARCILKIHQDGEYFFLRVWLKRVNNMEILRVDNLCKVYGEGENAVHALDDVSFTANRGEFISIVGSSGSGKSTLLHMIGGVDRPTSGKVTVGGINVYSQDEEELAIFRRRQVGLIYQFYNLIPTLTVEKNIALPMLLDKRKPEPAWMEELMESLGLMEKRNALPSQLSGGQQQRTAIARALLYRPAILLADEPTGSLDRRNAREVAALLKQANRERKQTILLITHDEKTALDADRIITMADGQITADERRR